MQHANVAHDLTLVIESFASSWTIVTLKCRNWLQTFLRMKMMVYSIISANMDNMMNWMLTQVFDPSVYRIRLTSVLWGKAISTQFRRISSNQSMVRSDKNAEYVAVGWFFFNMLSLSNFVLCPSSKSLSCWYICQTAVSVVWQYKSIHRGSKTSCI